MKRVQINYIAKTMGGPKIEIFFNNTDSEGRPIYYSSQNVCGLVVITLESEKKCRGIYVKIRGRSDVKWTETRTVTRDGKSTTKRTYFTANECYIEKKIYLFGSESGDTKTLQPGVYSHNFNCYLQPNLPSSYEGVYGNTRYGVKVVINRPWKFDHQEYAAFTVLNIRNLSREDELKHPATEEKKKTFCCFCCGSKPFFFTATIPQTGYVSGQDIFVKVEGRNRSTVDICGFNCQLEQKIKFTAHSPRHNYKYVESNIVDEDISGCDGGTEVTHEAVLRIPPVPPTDEQPNRIIDISYALIIQPDFGCCHISKEIRIPITIGTFAIDFNQIVHGESEEDDEDDEHEGYPQHSGEGDELLDNRRGGKKLPMPKTGQYGFIIPQGSVDEDTEVILSETDRPYGLPFGHGLIGKAPIASRPYNTPGGVLIHPTETTPSQSVLPHFPIMPATYSAIPISAPYPPAVCYPPMLGYGQLPPCGSGYPPMPMPPPGNFGAPFNGQAMPPYPVGNSNFASAPSYAPGFGHATAPTAISLGASAPEMPPPTYDQATMNMEKTQQIDKS